MARKPFYPFRSEQAKAKYEAFARERAKVWPPETETRTLETATGRTFVRACGRITDPPLVLLPGARSGSLMWTHHVAALSARHRTYALDVVGDVGFSVSRFDTLRPQDLMNWLDQVLAALEPERQLSLMGMSYGGWLAGQYALRFPGRVRRVVLLAPGCTVLPISFAFVARTVLLSIPFLGGDRGTLDRTLRWIFQDALRGGETSRALVEEAIADVKLAVRLFKLPRPPWPTVMTDKQWHDFSVPCLFLVGENEKIYSAEAALKRLNRVAPRIRAEIIPGAGHDLTMVQADLVLRKALEFLGEALAVETPAA